MMPHENQHRATVPCSTITAVNIAPPCPPSVTNSPGIALGRLPAPCFPCGMLHFEVFSWRDFPGQKLQVQEYWKECKILCICEYIFFFLLLWSLQWGIVTSTLGSTEHATQAMDWSAPGMRRWEQEPAKHLKLAPVSTCGWGFLEASGNQQSMECFHAGWVRAYEGLWMHREKTWFKVFHWLRLRQLPSSGRGFTASLHIARASPVAQGWRICRQCRSHRWCGFHLQPGRAPVFLTGESYGQGSLADYSP